MKRYKIGVNSLFFVLFPNFLFSQSIDGIKKEKEVIPLLCHTWNINFKTDSLIKIEANPQLFSTIDFMKNGSVIITTNSPVTGSWSYNKKSHDLILEFKNQALKFKILKFTKTDMILQENNGEGRKAHYWRTD